MERSNKKTTGKNKRSVDEITRETYDWWGRSIVFIKSTKIQSWKAIFIIAFISGAATALIWSVSLKIQTMSDAAAGAELSLVAIDQTVTKGDPVNVEVDLNTHSNNAVVVKAVIKYNLADFSLTPENIDTASGSFGIDKCSQSETPSGICSLVSVGVDENDATKGKAIITVAKPTPGLVGDTLVVAKLTFTSLRTTVPSEPNITLSYEQGSYTDSDVIVDDANGTDILSGAVGTAITVVGQACDPNGYTYYDWGNCVYNAEEDGYFTYKTVSGRTPADCVGEPDASLLQKSCDAPACTANDYIYSDWSPAVCPKSGIQTHEVTGYNTPACDETAVPPVLSTSCVWTPPTCEYTYSAWTDCSGTKQTRTETKGPADCVGGTPDPAGTERDCQECSYNYGTWTPEICPANEIQTRTESASPAGCSGGTKEDTQRSCTYIHPTCNFSYSDWAPDPCPVSGKQTRTETKYPADCVNGTPQATTQDCIYVPPTCTYAYGQWSTCPAGGGTQTRTESKEPADCVGGVKQDTTQTCTDNTCQIFDYSAWTPSVCPASGIQTRTAAPVSPIGCTGGNPQISQSCTYIVPPSDKHKDSHHKKKKKKKKVAVKKIIGDKTGPILQIPLLLNKNRGDRVWWTGSDTSGISYYTYKFRNSTIRTVAPSFNIPVNTPSGIYIVIIRGYDRAGNGSMRIVTIRVR